MLGIRRRRCQVANVATIGNGIGNFLSADAALPTLPALAKTLVNLPTDIFSGLEKCRPALSVSISKIVDWKQHLPTDIMPIFLLWVWLDVKDWCTKRKYIYFPGVAFSGNSTLLEGLAMRFACEMTNKYNVRVDVIVKFSRML